MRRRFHYRQMNFSYEFVAIIRNGFERRMPIEVRSVASLARGQACPGNNGCNCRATAGGTRRRRDPRLVRTARWSRAYAKGSDAEYDPQQGEYGDSCKDAEDGVDPHRSPTPSRTISPP